VDWSRRGPPTECRRCGKLAHKADKCWATVDAEGNVIPSPPSVQRPQRTSTPRVTSDGQRVCFKCQKPGHLARECPESQ
jgi:hypothetical protein